MELNSGLNTSFLLKQKFVKLIDVEPRYLDQNIVANIYSILLKKFEGISIEEFLIYKIHRESIKILSNVIGLNGMVCVKVLFDADIISPKTGQEICFEADKLVTNGIFGSLYKNLILFIPSTELSDTWSFSDAKVWVSKNGETISKGTRVITTIKSIKPNYPKLNIICSGTKISSSSSA